VVTIAIEHRLTNYKKTGTSQGQMPAVNAQTSRRMIGLLIKANLDKFAFSNSVQLKTEMPAAKKANSNMNDWVFDKMFTKSHSTNLTSLGERLKKAVR
jgi:hypothetical protein